MAIENSFQLKAGALRLSDLHAFWRQPKTFEIDPTCHAAIEASAACVARVVAEGRVTYGINTGFGSLARTTIPADQVEDLQRRLVLSHSAGVGAPLPDRVVRLIMLLKVNALARGFSGIRLSVLQRLTAMHNAGLLPIIPAKGSVGASGDLAPLAHMTSALIGEGEINLNSEAMPAGKALAGAGLEPIVLTAKEGLALLNGTQVSTALALEGLFAGFDVFTAALAAGAMSVDAALGSDAPFDPRIHEIRGQPGQIVVAERLRALLQDSEIRQSHLDCDRVQDPYSLRCQPQVMGASLDLLRSAAATLEREANAVSDNPLVFADRNEVLSGGNFHAEPVAMAADMMAIALAEVGSISERRTALLTDSRMSSLPPFLSAEPGLNSGFMLAHVTAAALASENKILAHPACIDSLPTSANQEDHVSMATHGARRLMDINANCADIAAIELLAAAQGVDFRTPLRSSPQLMAAHDAIRGRAAKLEDDRAFAPDIAAVSELVRQGWFHDTLAADWRPALHGF